MSASNPASSTGPSAEKRAYEPSMEEILASIRRIIADDQSLPGRGFSEPEAHAQARRAEPPPAERPPHAEPSRVEAPHIEPMRQDTEELPAHRDEALRAEPPHELRMAPAELEAVEPHGAQADEQAPPEPLPVARVSPIQWATPEPALEPAPSPYATSPFPQHPAAHGAVASPQYASPDGRPFFHDDGGAASDRGAAIEPEPHPATSRRHEPVDAAPPQPEPLPPSPEPFDEPIAPPAPPAPEFSPLFSAATDTSVASAFNVLAASRLAANSDDIMDLVRDMIRPLLRSWLDDNLPGMVERMVRDEIERVARGGR